MSHDLRWAARYAFTEELWQGRPRVVLDAALEAALLDDDALALDEEDDAPVLDLLDALLPPEPDETQMVWMGVRNEQTAVALKRARPGTTFVPVEQLADVLARARWETALLDLGAVVADDGESSGAQHARAAAETLGLRPAAGRSIVTWATAASEARARRALAYEELADLVLERLAVRGSTQRIYGLYLPTMAAVVDFGESLSPDDDEADVTVPLPRDADRRDDDDDDIPLVFDNTLGAQEPHLLELIAVTSAERLSEGLGLVELPPRAEPGGSALRAQLASVQARADRSEIERRRLLERVDDARRENESLRSELEASRRAGGADEVNPMPSAEEASFDALARDEALETSMAREQALKWRVSQLEHQLARAIARPVDALEAEVASLRARLESDGGAAATTPAFSGPPPRSGSFEAHPEPEPHKTPSTAEPVPPRRPAAPGPVCGSDGRWQRLAGELDGLIRKLERGGIGVLELRRHLTGVARRLRDARR